MASPREWKLVFTCPACEQASEIAADKMQTVVSCPHCHTRVVIDRDGIHNARKWIREARRNRERGLQEDRSYSQPTDYNMAHSWIWAGMFALLFLTLTPLIFWWNIYRASDSDATLYSAAKAFQSAWLDDDLETAETYVLEGDREWLQQWSTPRRAALLAGFGTKFTSKITAVEIVERGEEHAAVRVAFKVGGREQQVFQDWKFVNGDWRLRLR